MRVSFSSILKIINRKRKKFGEGLTTETHIIKSIICIFFWKIVMCFGFGCFQNVVVLVLYSTNPIDKVKFIIMKTKRFFNFFEKDRR